MDRVYLPHSHFTSIKVSSPTIRLKRTVTVLILIPSIPLFVDSDQLQCSAQCPLTLVKKKNYIEGPSLQEEEETIPKRADVFSNARIWMQLTFFWLNPFQC